MIKHHCDWYPQCNGAPAWLVKFGEREEEFETCSAHISTIVGLFFPSAEVDGTRVADENAKVIMTIRWNPSINPKGLEER